MLAVSYLVKGFSDSCLKMTSSIFPFLSMKKKVFYTLLLNILNHYSTLPLPTSLKDPVTIETHSLFVYNSKNFDATFKNQYNSLLKKPTVHASQK